MRQPAILIWRLVLVMGLYQLVRAIFLANNWDLYAEMPWSAVADGFGAGLRFDLATVALINAVYVVASFITWALPRTHPLWEGFLKVFFVGTNGLFFGLNLADTEYFKFSGSRLTAASLATTDDLARTTGGMLASYWYLTALGTAAIAGLWLFYNRPPKTLRTDNDSARGRFTGAVVILVILALGARGGSQAKPLRPTHAFDGSDRLVAQLTLNSAFTILKSLGHRRLEPVDVVEDWEAVKHIIGRTEGSRPEPVFEARRPNVVLFILESFNTSYMDRFRPDEGYTPFLSKLAREGHFYPRNFAGGRRSIDALPALLASVPSLMAEPLITSAYQSTALVGLPEILGRHGYETWFFHGGHDGTMFFDLMARRLGFAHYVGASDFPDPSLDDGQWGIFDKPFLSFAKKRLDKSETPFFATVFTLSSHHPYVLPESEASRFAEGSLPIHKTIRYTDAALKHFFDQARGEPWFEDTLFILTADHTSKTEQPRFRHGMGRYRVPLVFYSPGRKLPLVDTQTVAQHTDILPTVMDLLGIEPGPRAHFGHSLARDDALHEALLFGSRRYWLVGDDEAAQGRFDADGAFNSALFRWQEDLRLEFPRTPQTTDDNRMIDRLRAYIQYYRTGLRKNRLTW